MGIVRCFKWGELITSFSLKGRWVYLQSFRSLSSNLLSAYQLDVGLPSREVKKTYPTARDASETCVNSDILWGYEEGTLVTWTLSWIKTTQKFQKFQKRRSSGKDFWKRKQNPKQIWVSTNIMGTKSTIYHDPMLGIQWSNRRNTLI